MEDPIPVPTNTHTKSSQSFPAPNFCSPIAAVSTSLPIKTGRLKDLYRNSFILKSKQSKFGAPIIIPFLRSICPAAPTPIELISSLETLHISRSSSIPSTSFFDIFFLPFSFFVFFFTKFIILPLLLSTSAKRIFVPPKSIPIEYFFIQFDYI